MSLPDYEFDGFLDDECGIFVNGYANGNFDLRISIADGEFFACVPEGELLAVMREFFSGNVSGFDFVRF
ncbi:hypothetical protein [Pectobacterium carotovorum]|uniref:hypothetical protein n=1 Tax=Pectobacterium carotovorum TaxID=554 RepID=UPI00301A25BF